ncbi:MAG TPA: sporulation protein YtfJ [Candidatus Coproplasma excrementavium]|nr:sporulation protein YtfJ [Candidatus Coproplasma excrementavium]
MRIKDKTRTNTFEQPPRTLEKVADANTVVGDPIVTVSGTQVIPLSSVTVVNLHGGGEYGDIKTYKQTDGFKIAGGNGTVVTVKPKGFLIDDGKGCRLLKMEDSAIETIIDKTGQLVQTISDNA